MNRLASLLIASTILSCGGSQPQLNANDLLALEASARASCAVLGLEKGRANVPPRVEEFCLKLERSATASPCAAAPEVPEAKSGLDAGAGGSP